MALEFEWDAQKAETNLRKHRVSFEEAATVFGDSLAVIFDDEAHSLDEVREYHWTFGSKPTFAGFLH